MKINAPALLLAVLALGLGLGLVTRTYFDLDGTRPNVDVGNYSYFYESAGSPVILYSMSTCRYCQQVRDLLQANDVAFAERIVDRSQIARSEIKALKSERVPVLLIGRYKIEGYGKEEIMRAVRDNDPARTRL